jgi:DNA-binding XRE family transcriptional regulator
MLYASWKVIRAIDRSRFWRPPSGRMEPNLGAFGSKIAELRKARGWTKEKLAGEAGVGFNSLVTYEAGDREPKLFAAARIAQALGVDLMELVAAGMDAPPPAAPRKRKAA